MLNNGTSADLISGNDAHNTVADGLANLKDILTSPWTASSPPPYPVLGEPGGGDGGTAPASWVAGLADNVLRLSSKAETASVDVQKPEGFAPFALVLTVVWAVAFLAAIGMCSWMKFGRRLSYRKSWGRDIEKGVIPSGTAGRYGGEMKMTKDLGLEQKPPRYNNEGRRLSIPEQIMIRRLSQIELVIETPKKEKERSPNRQHDDSGYPDDYFTDGDAMTPASALPTVPQSPSASLETVSLSDMGSPYRPSRKPSRQQPHPPVQDSFYENMYQPSVEESFYAIPHPSFEDSFDVSRCELSPSPGPCAKSLRRVLGVPSSPENPDELKFFKPLPKRHSLLPSDALKVTQEFQQKPSEESSHTSKFPSSEERSELSLDVTNSSDDGLTKFSSQQVTPSEQTSDLPILDPIQRGVERAPQKLDNRGAPAESEEQPESQWKHVLSPPPKRPQLISTNIDTPTVAYIPVPDTLQVSPPCFTRPSASLVTKQPDTKPHLHPYESFREQTKPYLLLMSPARPPRRNKDSKSSTKLTNAEQESFPQASRVTNEENRQDESLKEYQPGVHVVDISLSQLVSQPFTSSVPLITAAAASAPQVREAKIEGGRSTSEDNVDAIEDTNAEDGTPIPPPRKRRTGITSDEEPSQKQVVAEHDQAKINELSRAPTFHEPSKEESNQLVRQQESEPTLNREDSNQRMTQQECKKLLSKETFNKLLNQQDFNLSLSKDEGAGENSSTPSTTTTKGTSEGSAHRSDDEDMAINWLDDGCDEIEKEDIAHFLEKEAERCNDVDVKEVHTHKKETVAAGKNIAEIQRYTSETDAGCLDESRIIDHEEDDVMEKGNGQIEENKAMTCLENVLEKMGTPEKQTAGEMTVTTKHGVIQHFQTNESFRKQTVPDLLFNSPVPLPRRSKKSSKTPHRLMQNPTLTSTPVPAHGCESPVYHRIQVVEGAESAQMMDAKKAEYDMVQQKLEENAAQTRTNVVFF